MAVSVFKTFTSGEVLTSSDLNSSFTQITSNGEDLGWPATKTKDFDGNKLDLDADADTSLRSDTDDQIDWEIGGTDLIKWVDGIYTYSDTDVGTAIGPILKLYRNSASAADADFIGALYFDGNDDAGTPAVNTYASIEAQIDDSGAGSEDGTLLIKTAVAGTLTTQADISSAGYIFTPLVSVLDSTEATTTTAASLKTAGGLAIVKKTIAGDLITVDLNGGTLPSFSGDSEECFVAQKNNSTTDDARIVIIAGIAGKSVLHLGDTDSFNVSEIIQDHNTGELQLNAETTFTVNVNTTDAIIIDSAADVTIGNGNLTVTDTSSEAVVQLTQNTATSTNFHKYIDLGALTIWISDGTTAEGALTGVAGDIVLNGGTGAGQTAFCDANGTNWTDM